MVTEAQGQDGEEVQGARAGGLRGRAPGQMEPRVLEAPSQATEEVQEDLAGREWGSTISKVGLRALGEIRVGAEVTWAVREARGVRSREYLARTRRLRGRKVLRVMQVQVVRIIRIRLTIRTSLPCPGASTTSGADPGRLRRATLSSRDSIPCRRRSRRKRRRTRGQPVSPVLLLPRLQLLPRRPQLFQVLRSGRLV